MVRVIATARGSLSLPSYLEFAAAVRDMCQVVRVIVIITMEEPRNTIVAIVPG